MMQEGDVFKTKSYGDLIVTKYVNSKAVCVKFVVTGYETTTQAINVITGSVKDRLIPTVHGIGITGDSQVKVDGKHTKEYRLWHNMLNRCYNVGYQKVQPTYIDCSVSENFRYFQYFKEWCNNQIGFNSVDENGFAKMQFWDFVSVFGESITTLIMSNQPIQDFTIYFKENDI